MHYYTLHYIILIVALVLAILAALQLSTPRINLMAAALALLILSFLVTGCATTATTWQEKLAPDALANKAVVATAEHYGGQKAADLASAGLSATASVLQGYVDKKPPLDIIVESPGVEGVGHILVDYLKDKGVVKQSTIDNLHKAATFAAKLTWTKLDARNP